MDLAAQEPTPGPPTPFELRAREHLRERLRARCRRLSGHLPQPPAKAFEDLARWCKENEVAWDHYGRGVVLEELELELAQRFGKPAGLFLPTGTMAQQIALRLWSDRAGTRRVGIPPHSHLELHEHEAHAVLSGLEPVALGEFVRVVAPSDLAALDDPLAAILIELPAREIGGKLPWWSELEQLVSDAHARGIRVHLDGARAFEAAAGYERSLAELGGLFDSVYVSLYKGIGGLAGAVLLGETDWIEDARVWKRRYGGDPITLLPFAASVQMHLAERAERMEAYTRHARLLARAFGTVPGVEVDPPAPQVNMMHLVLSAQPAAIVAARDEVAARTGLWLLNDPRAPVPGDPENCTRFELTVGDATLAVDVDEALDALRELMVRAGGGG